MLKQSLWRGVIAAVISGALLLPGTPHVRAESTEAFAETFTEGAVSLNVDGIPMEFDPAPYVVPPGRTMVPMRALFETLGARVSWNDTTRTVTATRGDRTVQLTIGSALAYVNGEERILDSAPELRHDRTFIPLRFVAEGLGSIVAYDDDNRMISVSSPGSPVVNVGVQKGMKLRFRLMLMRLVMNHHWEMLIEEASTFPGPITYSVQGTFADFPLPVMRRTLQSLDESRKFLPSILAVTETETAPWVSARVYQDLKSQGKVDNFVMGGFSQSGHTVTTLRAVAEPSIVFSMDERRVQLRTLEAVTPAGDRFWILDDPTNPLVVKFEPVGLPLPGSFGTVGYQIEWIGTDQ